MENLDNVEIEYVECVTCENLIPSDEFNYDVGECQNCHKAYTDENSDCMCENCSNIAFSTHSRDKGQVAVSFLMTIVGFGLLAFLLLSIVGCASKPYSNNSGSWTQRNTYSPNQR